MYISICFFSDHCEMLIGRLTLGNGGVLDSNSGGRHFDNGWFKREAWIEVDMIDCDDDEELIQRFEEVFIPLDLGYEALQ